MPVASRTPRTLQYHLQPHFPPYLVRETFDAVAQWNEALMRGRRAAEGRLPIDQIECDAEAERKGEGKDQTKGDKLCTVNLSTEAPIRCQTDNPAAFCFCGSPEERRGVCHKAYDPFETPEQANKRGVPNPYDCYVKGPADVAHPKDYSDYKPGKAYAYEFVGKECTFTLASNACDRDSTQPCQELGDLRYQFITHVQHGSVTFGGVAQPLSDPTTGELISSTASAAAESIEAIGTVASSTSRCCAVRAPRTRTQRRKSARLLRAARARAIPGRARAVRHGRLLGQRQLAPARLPEIQTVDPFKDLDARMHRLEPKMKQLQGQDGRAAVLSDRLQSLGGTDIASRIDSVIAADASGADPGAADAQAGLARARLAHGYGATTPKSYVADSPLDEAMKERTRQQIMAARNWIRSNPNSTTRSTGATGRAHSRATPRPKLRCACSRTTTAA